jgi:4-hydroxybenzoate polyprenyltransferase
MTSLLRTALAHLRLYESGQILAPGFFGLLTQQRLPPWPLLLAFGIAYASHLLSVYSYNDYCDWEGDFLNPRKTERKATRKEWLKGQTLILTAIFLAAVSFLPAGAAALLLSSQAVCMAYSYPRVRLKGILLGSEAAHFTVGCCYFMAGVMVAGGSPAPHVLGGLLFGLLYVSGGTFNEIMDSEYDRKTHHRHLVVLAGRGPVLRFVIVVHAVAIVLVALYDPTPAVLAACALAAATYAAAARDLSTLASDPQVLLRFRRRYRVIFVVLLLILSVSVSGRLP